MKNFLRTIFETAWGPAAAMLKAAGFFLVVGVIGCLFQNVVRNDILGLVLTILVMPIWILTLALALAAFLRSLWKRCWRRAAAQLGLCLAAFFAVFMAGALFATGIYPLVSHYAFGTPPARSHRIPLPDPPPLSSDPAPAQRGTATVGQEDVGHCP